MAARRRRFRFRADAGRGPRISLEWLGFRDAGIPANLDTAVSYELVAPGAAGAIAKDDLTVLRVVGNLSFTAQSGVIAGSTLGAMLFKANVGGDQVIDDDFSALVTDVDKFDHSGIMWWQSWQGLLPQTATSEFDEVPVVVPIDIKVKRKLNKRDTLIMRVDAGTTGRSRVSANLRTLIRIY